MRCQQCKVNLHHQQKFFKKGCHLYASHILDSVKDKGPRLEDHLVLQDFKDVFPNEVPQLSPNKDIDFTIDLVPGGALASKIAYKINTLELLELKIQSQKLWGK